jgi:hypothetical protein
MVLLGSKKLTSNKVLLSMYSMFLCGSKNQTSNLKIIQLYISKKIKYFIIKNIILFYNF